jgi:hypothetical protein
MTPVLEELVQKISKLPPDKVIEVNDFVDFLHQRASETELTRAARLSEGAFKKVWDNPDDAEYDNL